MIDLSGQTFGRLAVVKRDGSLKTNVAWLCLCECGAYTRVAGNRLREGKTRSCGCLSDDSRRARQRTHGESSSRLFRIWTGMKTRCLNPNAVGWPYYGGRGIKVCDAWRDSYEAFAHWARGSGYSPTLTIERVDVDGPYSPENCCWIPRDKQAQNKTTGRLDDGRRISEVAKENGLKIQTVRERIRKGWPKELAATTPLVDRWSTPFHRQHQPPAR